MFLLLLLPSMSQQQGKAKRLILKDGSYELISRYEIVGDRVRYFSFERNNWEEMPASLIDWPATEQHAGQLSRQNSEKSAELQERAAAERKEEEARIPLVAPGIHLPSPNGVYLLDTYQNRPELNSLVQNDAGLNKNTGKNILRGVINPIAGPRQTVELKGMHARIRAHTSKPSIYFSIDPADPDTGYSSVTAKDHLRIVRCRPKNKSRVVVALDIALYGKVKQKADYIDIHVEPISDYWVKIVPLAGLPTGEYALVEFDEKGRMNQYVWDFGVDPAAPENPASIPSIPDRNEPVLQSKPKQNSPAK